MNAMTGENYFTVEPEHPNDESAIEVLLDTAFGPNRLAKTSYRLRDGQEPEAGLALTLRNGEELCGTIRFWPIEVGPGRSALLLGPLAVHPDHHGHGGGQMLMRTGLEQARGQGHGLVFLVGDLPYYHKAGFKAVPKGRVLMPGPFDSGRLLYQELIAGSFNGVAGMMQIPAK